MTPDVVGTVGRAMYTVVPNDEDAAVVGVTGIIGGALRGRCERSILVRKYVSHERGCRRRRSSDVVELFASFVHRSDEAIVREYLDLADRLRRLAGADIEDVLVDDVRSGL